MISFKKNRDGVSLKTGEKSKEKERQESEKQNRLDLPLCYDREGNRLFAEDLVEFVEHLHKD